MDDQSIHDSGISLAIARSSALELSNNPLMTPALSAAFRFQGDSKNRILQGLTRLSNQILSASQRQTLEALTDAHALGCFE